MHKAPPAPPWKKRRKSTKPEQPMTDGQKALARARAQEAGRPYPNLIDNMAIIREDKKFEL